ncbi:MAG: 1-deoxy-D-xylulose-5-phosphate synthase [Nitrospinae bacterium]|nr:1-deoxy-D-xylulose-5-phosphate synthase [Nitrospinota bacterium]
MDSILSAIDSPADLKKVPRKDLPRLAEEIREFIIQTVSKTGGHLSPNLGVVELSIAIHYCFDSPQDKIIWDVGHQAYTHKLLTGRRKNFHTLRQFGGVCGFPAIAESPHDAFSTGHSGTSISAAVGYACGRDAKGENNKVIAVIGDGSMTSGISFEGLNHAGGMKKNLLVILNDNEMSISPNVGALSSYLNQILTGKLFNKMKGEIDTLLGVIPGIGKQLAQFAHRLEEQVKGIFVPGRIFEDLGFDYIGPIDGHNLDHLIDAFENVKNLKGPLLVHAVTKKGKGYKPAEDRSPSFHGVSPFNVETGDVLKKHPSPPSYTAIFSETIIKLAREDEKIIGITAAMADGAGLADFAAAFPDRFYDVGIAEQHAVTFAAGLALEGFKPVAAIYSTFLQRALDQVLLDVCLMNLPVTFVADRAGIVGEDGPTHQGVFDLSLFRSFPNMVVMSPKDENEFRHMLKTAIDHKGPALVRYPRGSGSGAALDEKIKPLEIGKAEILREGKNAVIFALGCTVGPSMQASEILKKEGMDIGVVNVRFVKPLDGKAIERFARKARLLVTVEENMLQGGFGSAVMEFLEEKGIWNVPVKRIGLPDAFIEHGAPNILRKKYGLDAEGIAETVRKTLALDAKILQKAV